VQLAKQQQQEQQPAPGPMQAEAVDEREGEEPAEQNTTIPQPTFILESVQQEERETV
jgi:hypothetical protein